MTRVCLCHEMVTFDDMCSVLYFVSTSLSKQQHRVAFFNQN